jgi:hypothetical protein
MSGLSWKMLFTTVREAAYYHKPGRAELLFDFAGFLQGRPALVMNRIHRKGGDACATREVG